MPRRPVLAAAALIALLAAPASAQERRRPEGRRPSGVTVSVDLGGGGDVSGPTGVFEAEIGAGYAVGKGWALELALVLGMAPGNYFGLRPGVHWAIPETPFYARLAFDLAGPGGSLDWRWLLLGAGVELRFTDVVGGFVEADTGIPLSRAVGLPLLVRGGVFFSF
ncbi:MAG TPA: hypothetical protein VIV59_10935 [Anaeromyxobacteraceae bacterium]